MSRECLGLLVSLFVSLLKLAVIIKGGALPALELSFLYVVEKSKIRGDASDF